MGSTPPPVTPTADIENQAVYRPILAALERGWHEALSLDQLAASITRVVYTEALLQQAKVHVDQLAGEVHDDVGDTPDLEALLRLGSGETDPTTRAAMLAYQLGTLSWLVASTRVDKERMRIAAWLYLGGILEPGAARRPEGGAQALLWAAKQIVDGELAETDWTEHVGDFVSALERRVPSEAKAATDD